MQQDLLVFRQFGLLSKVNFNAQHNLASLVLLFWSLLTPNWYQTCIKLHNFFCELPMPIPPPLLPPLPPTCPPPPHLDIFVLNWLSLNFQQVVKCNRPTWAGTFFIVNNLLIRTRLGLGTRLTKYPSIHLGRIYRAWPGYPVFSFARRRTPSHWKTWKWRRVVRERWLLMTMICPK